MSASYIHTKRKAGFTQVILRFLAFLYFVALAGSIVYLWMFTKDRFISTAEFKISHQDSSAVSSSLAVLALPGLSDSGSVDSQMAIGYIDSTDLLLEIEKEFDLVKHYTSPKTDLVFRMTPGSLLEDRLEYYRKRIFSHFDTTSGMTVITVDTFDAKLSQKIAARLLQKAEDYINITNQQIADKQIDFVHSELDRAAKNVEEVNRELITLQNEHNFINPEEVISATLKSVQEMKMDVFRSEAELASLLRDNPNNPRVDTIRSRIRSINELIDQESAKLTGPEKDRLGQLLILFKQLELKLEFVTRLRAGAELALEKNRVDAISRSRFFTIVQNPYLPEDVAIPRRPYMTVTILVLGIMLFLILRALTHSIFERV